LPGRRAQGGAQAGAVDGGAFLCWTVLPSAQAAPPSRRAMTTAPPTVEHRHRHAAGHHAPARPGTRWPGQPGVGCRQSRRQDPRDPRQRWRHVPVEPRHRASAAPISPEVTATTTAMAMARSRSARTEPCGSHGGQTYAGSVCLWNIATGKVIATFSDPSGYALSPVVFSPDGKSLATGDNNDANQPAAIPPAPTSGTSARHPDQACRRAHRLRAVPCSRYADHPRLRPWPAVASCFSRPRLRG
jgi:hypothetical protein